MITNSFLFLPNIGYLKEKSLWKQGVKTWNDFLSRERIRGISSPRKQHYNEKIRKARTELYNNNAAYFSRFLPLSETWRLYDFFKEEAVFLDIETTGVSSYADITVIGLFDGFDTKIMIKGVNLDPEVLKQELQQYKLILTFNGGSFDLPFIAKRFPLALPRIPHIDLKTVTRKLGYSGGLKSIEKEFGIAREELVDGMNGGDAVTLWRMYKATGDKHYLNLLVEYNEEDIINLKTIADKCCRELSRSLIDK